MRFIPLYSGSSGNSSLICAGDTRVLVDAGLTGKAIVSALECAGEDPANLSGIVVTHEHIDHVKGVGVLSRRYGIPVYANEATWRAMAPLVGNIPVRSIRTFTTGQNFYIGDIDLTPFAISHDAAEPVGYRLFHKGRSVVCMTDTGVVTDALRENANAADLILLESNHDPVMLKNGPYPYQLKRRILSEKGHLSNGDAGLTLVKLYETGVRRAILAHLSRENNTEQLAMSTVRGVLTENGIAEKDFFLTVARRGGVTGIFEL